jgi:tetratricopeptide (TPR) repeat protein
MPEAALVLVGVLLAGAVVLAPLRRGLAAFRHEDDAGKEARYRAALEAIRDLEADRRAGTLDEAEFAAQLAEAEERGAAALADGAAGPAYEAELRPSPAARRAAATVAAVIAVALVVGVAIPASGLANATARNESLAEAQEAEAARQERIAELVDRVAADPLDVGALSELADAYLAGGTEEDLVRAAVALRVLIELEPERPDAYERIVTAYLRAGDYANGRAALDAYADLDDADPAELAFFEGLIALRGEEDPAAALAAFDRFLELAPDDPRAGMVRGLRDEAAESR